MPSLSRTFAETQAQAQRLASASDGVSLSNTLSLNARRRRQPLRFSRGCLSGAFLPARAGSLQLKPAKITAKLRRGPSRLRSLVAGTFTTQADYAIEDAHLTPAAVGVGFSGPSGKTVGLQCVALPAPQMAALAPVQGIDYQVEVGEFGSLTDIEEDRVGVAYALIKKETHLLFGVDKHIQNLPVKRTSGGHIVSSNCPVPRSVSLGYGELTLPGFGKIYDYMADHVNEELRLSEHSAFIDVGSGFGKCVLHTALRHVGRPASCVGVEYCETRVQKASDVLALLRERGNIWRNALMSTRFIRADAVEVDFSAYTHIFAYDYIFSEAAHRALLPRIMLSDFRILACFCSERKLRKFGFDIYVTLLDKMGIGTTGKERHTIYFYTRTSVPFPR